MSNEVEKFTGANVELLSKGGYMGAIPGLEAEAGDAEEFIIPRIKFNAAESLQIPCDRFYKVGTNEEFETLQVVMLGRTYSRARFPKKFATDSKPLCMTPDKQFSEGKLRGYVCDLETGRPKEGGAPIECGVVYGQNRKVACPYAAFKGSDAPECTISLNVLCWEVEKQFPFEITFRGTSFGPMYKVIADFVTQRKALFTAVMEFSLQKNKDGKYSIINVQKKRELTAKDGEELASYAEKFASFSSKRVVEDHGPAETTAQKADDNF